MAKLVRVCKTSDIKESTLAKFTVDGEEIVIGRVGERYFAVQASCPHKGGPLEKGELQDRMIVCPRHRYKFDVFTGKLIEITYPPEYGAWREASDLKTFKVQVLNGYLVLEI